ncbi:MAG: universal stress protein, partial [Candidatus Eremiobacteraeota bacterium]|nr:universal stress protein [Candidatus Eremiobacteraeota bacterium]
MKRVTDDGVVAKTAVLDGPSAEAIVAYAKERKVDAIVMGTQGKGGLERLFLGSTADGVLRRAEVPVFVVPPAANDDDATFGRIFVAVDDSDPSDAAVDFALGLAAVDKAALVFCCVVEVKDVLEGATAYACDTAPMIEELHAMASS